MTALRLPTEIEAVFREFRTCEFSTLARDGTPITWPVLPFYQPAKGYFLITTSPGLPQKAINIRRDPRVAMLFSDPTASGLVSPPAVLVQGDAEAPDDVSTSVADLEDVLLSVYRRQPASGMYSSNPVMRALFDWYYMRLLMYVRPRRVFCWPGGDFSQPPAEIEIEVEHVR